VDNLEKALLLKQRGYIVLPDPTDPAVQEAFKEGVFSTFERHSRVGFPEEKSFVEDIAWLRQQGAKKVFLKTGAYHAAAVAFTLKCASEAKIDLLTFDGAGGGTGMSPVPMMNECSTPALYLFAQVLDGARILRQKGKYVPDLAFAGGFVNETPIFKAIALSNFGGGPFVKTIAIGRSPLTAVMKSDYFIELHREGKLPKAFTNLYGNDPEHFFMASTELQQKYGDAVGKDISWPAVGLYTYLVDRIGVGLQQLMAGCRKWRLDLLDRSDLVALTERAAKVTGLPLPEEAGRDAFERILDF
jgi:hypothetical protein